MAKKLKEYFDKNCVLKIAKHLHSVDKDFIKVEFVEDCLDGLEELELKARVRKIGGAIYRHTSGDYVHKIKLMSKILGPTNPGSFGTFNNYFWQWCLSSVVEQYGFDDRDSSLDFIYKLTQRSTGEFALRPFLLDDPEYVLALMTEWSDDKNFHVRRLSSEALRPLLPWAKKCDYFVEKPARIFKHLKSLSEDTEKYVINSVANHMGDMLKLNFDATIAELQSWADTENNQTKWLIRHALRNQRKKGIQKAITLYDNLS